MISITFKIAINIEYNRNVLQYKEIQINVYESCTGNVLQYKYMKMQCIWIFYAIQSIA